MRNGTAYLLKPSAPLTAVTGSSWSRSEYPTLSLYTWAGKHGLNLATEAVRTTWPTATAGDAKSSGSRGKRGDPGNKANEGTSLTDATARDGRHDPTTCKHGGKCKPKLNPRFVESLMGFPEGWTDLEH